MNDSVRTRISYDGLDLPELRQPWWRWEEPPKATFVMEAKEVHGARAFPGHPVPAIALIEWPAIGVIRLFERTVSTPHVSFSAVGIGGVYVAERYRGVGVASAMLAALFPRLAEDGSTEDVAVLWAARHHALYARAGFVEVGMHLWVRPLRAGLVVRPGRHVWSVDGGKF